MSNKPLWVWILLYLAALGVLALVSYIAVGWYFGSYPKVPIVSQVLPPAVLPAPRRLTPLATPTPGPRTVAKMAVKKIELVEGGFF
ncbi:MAG: hypothetical protein ACOY0S_04070, partial [Patescibacteria group bacterium]